MALDMFGTQDTIIVWICLNTVTVQLFKLIGTTAGYVGYDDNSNTLTETCSSQIHIYHSLGWNWKADHSGCYPSPPSSGMMVVWRWSRKYSKLRTLSLLRPQMLDWLWSNLTEDADKPELMDRLKAFFRQNSSKPL